MPYINALLIFVLAVPLGLGIGGGGLFLLYLSDILGFSRETAIYLNLVFFLAALLSSAASHIRYKRVSYPILGTILLFGLPSALCGRAVASCLSSSFLRILLGSFLLSSGIIAFFKGKKAKDNGNSLDKR